MLNKIELKTAKILSKRDILNRFYTFAPKTDMKIGMELERLPVDKNNIAVRYDKENCGVKQILEEISATCGWGKLYANGVLIGLRNDLNLKGTTITLEPKNPFTR